MQVGGVAADFIVPDFVPKSGVYIETDPNAERNPRSGIVDESAEIERLWTSLMELKAGLPPGFRLTPIAFEKDNDENHHMDAIAGLANMRARNYKYVLIGVSGEVTCVQHW